MEEKTSPNLKELSVAPENEIKQETCIETALKDLPGKTTESHKHGEGHDEDPASLLDEVSDSPNDDADNNDIHDDNDKNDDSDNDVTPKDTNKTVFKPVPAPRTKLNVLGKS